MSFPISLSSWASARLLSTRRFLTNSMGSRAVRMDAISSRLRYVVPGSDMECPWYLVRHHSPETSRQGEGYGLVFVASISKRGTTCPDIGHKMSNTRSALAMDTSLQASSVSSCTNNLREGGGKTSVQSYVTIRYVVDYPRCALSSCGPVNR